MRASLPTLLTLIIAALPGAAAAQSEDAVAVLEQGGVDTVRVFDLTAGAPRVAVALGERRILPASIGAARVTDIKVLPDGSHLLANVGGRGAVVTTPDGEGVRWVLDEAQRLTGVDSATVASYFAPGEPSLVVTADAASSTVLIRDTSTDSTVWFETLRLLTSRAVIAQVAVLPDNVVAMAVNWPEAGIYGIRLRDTSDPASPAREIVSVAHAEAAADRVIVPELDVIRDLMVLADGRMLVTTRYAMLLLAPTGELVRHLDIGQFPEVSGELAGVRVLPSGLWAIGTFEPGFWVQPHPNHRVHWFDPVTETVVATSEPLQRAPIRVEPNAGIGGTGTVGFDGGLDLLGQGDASTIELVNLQPPISAAIGTNLAIRATVRNAGELPVALAMLGVRAASGPCTATPTPEVEVGSVFVLTLAAAQQFSFTAELLLDAQFAPGPWCAFVEGRDQRGTLRRYGDPVAFEILPATGGYGSVIDVRPLPHNTGPEADVGIDAGDAGDTGPTAPEKGCCATAPARAPAGAAWALLAALALLSHRRRTRSV